MLNYISIMSFLIPTFQLNLLVLIYLSLNIFTTILIFRRKDLRFSKAFILLLLIWLIPFSAILIIANQFKSKLIK